VKRTESAAAAAAEPGHPPGAAVGRKVTIVGDVIATDPKTQKVTVKGQDRTEEIKVSDPEQFKLISKGDQIQLTYAEAVAVEVAPAKKAAKTSKPKAEKSMSKPEGDKPKSDAAK
jgi:hypothetical protein